jgi:RNA polymerase sigma-70 factor (ECF subfamily)
MNREKLFREAIRENSQRIFRICCYYFENTDERSDAYQESLIRIWENLHGYRGNAKLSTWIYRVVVNTCLSYIRKDKRRRGIFESGKDLKVMDIPAQPEEDDTPEPDEKLAFFQKFMTELPSSDRTLVSLYLEDLSTREMADVTGISEANVRVRIHRIREKIQNQWEEKQHGTR